MKKGFSESFVAGFAGNIAKSLALLLLASVAAGADGHGHEHHEHEHHEHEHGQHRHEQSAGGELAAHDADAALEEFAGGLPNAQIAVVSVHGMVCDFCARGIEKTFRRDKSVVGVDVNLSLGRVLVAYAGGGEIDFEDIREKILANGQSVTDIRVMGR